MSYLPCPYEAGRKHIGKLNADRRRVEFINKVSKSYDIFAMQLTEAQQNFVARKYESQLS